MFLQVLILRTSQRLWIVSH